MRNNEILYGLFTRWISPNHHTNRPTTSKCIENLSAWRNNNQILEIFINTLDTAANKMRVARCKVKLPLLKNKDRPWAGFAIGSLVTWVSSPQRPFTGHKIDASPYKLIEFLRQGILICLLTIPYF